MPARALTIITALIALALIPSSAFAAPKKAQLRFSATTYSVPENAGTFNVVIQRTGNTRIAASAQLSVDPSSTASSPADYSVTTGTINFASGETTKNVQVTLVDNNTANAPNKTIVFKLSNPGSNTQVPGATALTTLTIIDNEGPGTLDFSASSYTVVENGGVATVTVNRLGASNLKVSIDYATQGALTNPATAVSDYTPISPAQTLTFNPGEMSKTFQVQIADDSNAEGPETVNLVLSNPKNLSGGSAPQVGPNSPAVLTINDNDVSTFNFQSSLFSVNEDDGSGQLTSLATITVTRGGATNVAASVNYATSDGTATAPGDYIATNGTLNFAAGETTKTFTVTVKNDGIAEPNETVNLTLTQGAATVANAVLGIVDNDNPKGSIQLSDIAYSVSESGGSALVTVTLSKQIDADVSVNYATSDGTATAGSDYTAASGTLTFVGKINNGGVGQTQKTFTVPITDDPDAEDDETITLTLSNASPNTAAVLGAPSTATLTIADDDPPGDLEFNSLRYDAAESDGQADVTVRRVGGTNGTVTVDYATSDGTASGDSDYTPTSGTLSFGPGETEKTFSIPVTWDGRGEGPETINLSLTNPTGGADLAQNTAAIVRIADDGASGALQLTSSSYSVGEAAGLATVTVTRGGGSLGGPVTVDYTTNDATAIAGSDYTATSGTLTFGPGELAKSFTVPVTSDSAAEGDELFQVILSNPAGGAILGTPAGASVTITDDDTAPASQPQPDPGPVGTPTVNQAPAGDQAPASNPDPGSSPATSTADKRAPKLTLSARKVQKALKAKLFLLAAKCDENCKLRFVARVAYGKKAVTIGKLSLKGKAGKKVTVKVKLSKKALARLTKALKRGTAKVTIAVVAADAARNATKASRIVTARL
jgi:Calx-beta domain